MIPTIVIAILKNESLNKFHPIVYRYAPLPGGSDVPRFRSLFHHTNGFVFQEEALKECGYLAIKCSFEFGPTAFAVEDILSWDGTGIPADNRFFSNEEYTFDVPEIVLQDFGYRGGVSE